MKVYTKTGVLEITPYLCNETMEVKTIAIPVAKSDIMLAIDFVPYDGKKFWMVLNTEMDTNPIGDPDIEFSLPGAPDTVMAIYFTTDEKIGADWDAAHIAWRKEIDEQTQ